MWSFCIILFKYGSLALGFKPWRCKNKFWINEFWTKTTLLGLGKKLCFGLKSLIHQGCQNLDSGSKIDGTYLTSSVIVFKGCSSDRLIVNLSPATSFKQVCAETIQDCESLDCFIKYLFGTFPSEQVNWEQAPEYKISIHFSRRWLWLGGRASVLLSECRWFISTGLHVKVAATTISVWMYLWITVSRFGHKRLLNALNVM